MNVEDQLRALFARRAGDVDSLAAARDPVEDLAAREVRVRWRPVWAVAAAVMGAIALGSSLLLHQAHDAPAPLASGDGSPSPSVSVGPSPSTSPTQSPSEAPSASGTTSPAPTGTPSPHLVVAAHRRGSGLVPAAGAVPANGGCGGQRGAVVVVAVEPYGPTPPCTEIAGDQKLRVVNATNDGATGTPLTVQWADYPPIVLKPGWAVTYPEPASTYLALGVHQVAASSTIRLDVWRRH